MAKGVAAFLGGSCLVWCPPELSDEKPRCQGVRVMDHNGKRLAKDIGGKQQDSTNLI